jgi:hypothetical protein
LGNTSAFRRDAEISSVTKREEILKPFKFYVFYPFRKNQVKSGKPELRVMVEKLTPV